MLDENNKYNLPALKAKVNEILGKQKSLLLMINTPAHNPTGYSLSEEDLQGVIDIIKEATAGTDKTVTLLLDVAYIDYAGEKTMCALLVAVETLQQTAGYENYDKFYEGLGMITGIIRNARKHVQARAEQFAETYKDDTVIYTMGSGAGYGAAYMESICIFMEMQWLDSSSIHTGEYFHGPFEITDANRPFMIQISEGSTRELDERALKFLHTYAKRIEVLDAKELGLSTIDASVVDYFNHSLFNNVYPIYNHELAEKKEHPLSTRRYMWKVEY